LTGSLVDENERQITDLNYSIEEDKDNNSSKRKLPK
jgi:hypothetical protein